VSNLPEPEELRRLLSKSLAEDIACVRKGDALVLDTPYILQDGHLFRAYLHVDGSGAFNVSDGGWAGDQFAIFGLTGAALRSRSEQARAIADELCLTWSDGEFSYAETELSAALRRLAALARGVDRCLSLLQARPRPVAP
jgi:hypothetical protein